MPRDELRLKADQIINDVPHRTCPHCSKVKPLDDFGLRRFKGSGSGGGDLVTNQSWCRDCRTGD